MTQNVKGKWARLAIELPLGGEFSEVKTASSRGHECSNYKLVAGWVET